MRTQKLKPALIYYEIRNVLGNPYSLFFGIIFPILMLYIITRSLKSQVPPDMLVSANTAQFITLSMIIPLAVIFLGYSANYSQELENEIPLRMQLFGFSESVMMLAKVIAQALAMTGGMILYTVISYTMLDISIPQPMAFISLVVCLYLLGAVLFALAHALSGIFRKFGITYAICMILYFLIMILCGMMGIPTSQLPKFLQSVAALLPMSYISSDFADFWTKGSYNFIPMLQSFLFLGAVSGILILYSNYRNRRVVR